MTNYYFCQLEIDKKRNKSSRHLIIISELFILKNLLKKNSNIILYCIIFGVTLSAVMGPLRTVAGIAIG